MQKKIRRSLGNTETSVILGANWFQFAAGERILNPRVLSRMLLWCQEGRGRVRVNGTWFPMQPDDFLFLPWQHEVLYLADEQVPFWVAGIHLIPDYPLDRKLVFSVSHRAKDAWANCRWRKDVRWPALEGVCAGVARSLDPIRLLGGYIVERFDGGAMPETSLRKLSQLLVEEIAHTLAQKPVRRQGNDAVRKAQEFVESHLNRQISLGELARIADCSLSTLRRQFQQTLRMPPYEWILQTRLQRARRLLTTTTLRIKEVAERVGFSDPFQFSRLFKERIGTSPRFFRTKHAFSPR